MEGSSGGLTAELQQRVSDLEEENRVLQGEKDALSSKVKEQEQALTDKAREYEAQLEVVSLGFSCIFFALGVDSQCADM